MLKLHEQIIFQMVIWYQQKPDWIGLVLSTLN